MKTYLATIPTNQVTKRELLFRLRRRSGGKRWQFGIEMGANSGYKHYQVRYECSNGDYEIERRYWGDIQLELQEAGGWSNYELKGNNFYSYMDDELGKYRFGRLQELQLCILAHGKRQSDRTISIVVDELGGIVGKTFLARRCSLNGTGIYIDGTDTENINRDLYDIIKDKANIGRITLFIDLTRNDKLDARLFRGIETIKNGYVSDARYTYEYRWILPPRIFVFANHEPEWDKLSKDRWDKMFVKEKDGKILLWDRHPQPLPTGGEPRVRIFNRNN